MKIMSPHNVEQHPNYGLFQNFLARNDECSHANSGLFFFLFFVYFTQTSSDGNVNEKKKNITSSAPDDIFQETPTQVVENSRGKRFHI